MNRVCLATLCACTLLLGGCLQTSKTVFPQHYTLEGGGSTGAGSTGAPAAQQPGARGQGQHILQISRIEVPQWLQGTNMYYRLGYLHDARISSYGRSDWVAPPPTLLEHIVQSAIRDGGGWRAVIGPGNNAQADVSVHIRLDQFSQYFARPNDSSGIIDASATLVDNHDASVIAQKHFRIEVAAPSADAAGGVKALSQASRQFATRLQSWLQAVRMHQSGPSPEQGNH